MTGSIKRVGAVILSIVLMLSLVTVIGVQKASAKDTSEIIDRYNEEEYNIKNDGKFWFIQEPGGQLKLIGYKGVLSGTLNIPTEFGGYPVTSIGDEAFREATDITGKLIIPSCIESIGAYAFTGCTGLTGVEFKYGLKSIGNGAFESCKGLAGGINLPNSVTSIGGSVFAFCTGFTGSIHFPVNSSFTKIPDHFIYHAGTFTGELAIPDQVTEIASNAFHFGYFDNATLKLSKNLKLIGHWAFFACSGLVGSLELPDGLEDIEYGAFNGCSGFTGDLYIPNSVKLIEYDAFKGMSSLNGKLHISERIEKIQNSTFESCSSLTGDIVIPDSVKEIGEGAFRYSRGFNGTVTLPNNDSFNEIKNETFYLCTNLSGTVKIPEGVTRIGDLAFRDCEKLTGIVLPDGLHNICYQAFCNCSSLKGSLNLPGSLTEIGYQAFDDCESLSGSLTIPRGVEGVGSYAFSGCRGLNGTLTIENGVRYINQYAFRSCSFTGALKLPDSVEGVGDYAFYCCNFDGKLTLSNMLRYIGNDCFYGCSGFKGALSLPGTLTSIGPYAFYECSGFTGDLLLPDKVESVSDFAFYGCKGMTGTLSIPESLKRLGSYAFGDDFFSTIKNASEQTIKVESSEDGNYPTNYIFSKDNRDIYCYHDSKDVRVSEIGKGTYTLVRSSSAPVECEHEWKLTKTKTPADCVKTGEGEYTCVKCGVSKNDTIPALGHTYVNKITKATMTADGKFTPTCSVCGATKTATVIAKASAVKLSSSKLKYNGKAQKPELIVKDSGGKAISTKYYSAAWSNESSKAVGTYTVKITFKGNYSGSKTLTYKIVPKAVSGLKNAKAAKTAITLSWSKAAGAKYYDVYGSSDGKTFKKVETVSANTIKVTKIGGKALAAGKTYYFKVRALDSTKKLVGAFSAVLKTGTQTKAPAVSKLTSTKSKTATVTWNKVTGAKTYIVYTSTDGKTFKAVKTGITKTSYTITGLKAGKKIYVRIAAVNAYGAKSAQGAAKNVTVKK